MNLETPEDLQDVKCPKCQGIVIRFGSRKQLNFKCQTRGCDKFYSDKVLREYLLSEVK